MYIFYFYSALIALLTVKKIVTSSFHTTLCRRTLEAAKAKLLIFHCKDFARRAVLKFWLGC